MLLDLLRAIFELGLPVTALSWLMFYRLYGRGELARDADRKAIDAGLKEIKKVAKESKESSDSLLQAKWFRFGGGFYGVAALWTLLVIEASGIGGIIIHPSIIESMFHDGPTDFIVNQVTSQVGTFVQAAIWFMWWPEKGHGPVFWIAVAYLGYAAGLRLARYETRFGTRVAGLDSRARLRSLMAFRRDASKNDDDRND